MMKGVAVLLMIFLHLFNRMHNVELCHSIIHIGGLPLAHILTRAANPVAFFLILGGYGMYKVTERGDRHRWSRVLRLYIHYWIILIIFLGIGSVIYPNVYPGSVSDIISNITSFHTTYNGEMWFLLPYVILTLLAPTIFQLMKRYKAWQVVVVTLSLHLCTSYCISRHGVEYLYDDYWIYNPLLVCHLLFPFSLGAVAAREHFFEKINSRLGKLRYTPVFAVGGVTALVLISCVFKYNYFYEFLVITALFLIPIGGLFRKILMTLGDHSMNMWMTHSWFCYYLFHDFIYSLKYPLVIFVVVVLLSYGSSIIINTIAVPIKTRFLVRKDMAEKAVV